MYNMTMDNETKLLQQWHEFELTLNSENTNNVSYRQGEVWWVSIGQNLGDEENGKGDAFMRPVLIVRGFSESLFWGVPLSSQLKNGDFYYSFKFGDRASTAILSQMRAYDTKRLISFQSVISSDDFEQIKNKLIKIIQD